MSSSRVLLLVFPLLLFVCVHAQSMHNPFYCYAEDPIRPQLAMFASETPYEVIRGRNIDTNASSCTPTKFWLVGRSGTRLPSPIEVDLMFDHIEALRNNILSNYDAGRTTLCASDIQLIRNWRLDAVNITRNTEAHLTLAGWNEVEGIAQRYQRAFPTLFPTTYSAANYSFRSAPQSGPISSIEAFADGLFGLNGHRQVEYENIADPDLLLSFYLNCALFAEFNTTSAEMTAFFEGPEYQQMIVEVSNKLGFHGSRVLSPQQIDILRLFCEFEQLWNLNGTSPFCAAFSVANFQVVDYSKDLHRYHTHSYGQFPTHRRLLENLPCHLMQDLLHFLRSDGPNDRRTRILNGQPHNVQFLINVFGAFKDRLPLTRHNFAQQAFRLFRLAQMRPKAGNLAVVRYDCPDGDHDIVFLLNERPLSIEGCQPNGVCKLAMLLERFSQYLDVNCSEIFCTNA